MSSSGNNDDDDIRPAAKPPKKAGGGAGAGGGGANDPCDIVERTRVNSPDKTVRLTIRDGDVLSVEFEAGPPRRLLVRPPGGVVLGSITSPSMAQIIACIQEGHEYVAIVQSTSGGIVDVLVQRA